MLISNETNNMKENSEYFYRCNTFDPQPSGHCVKLLFPKSNYLFLIDYYSVKDE